VNKSPYISFVATSRNDDHGGEMSKRMQIFVQGLIHQCNKFQLPCELVMVDWNSPDPKELLSDVLPETKADDFLKIRYIVVPPEEHAALRFSEHMGLFQMIAKNVGIRRAQGEFVLCTNVDLLFSDALFEILAKRELKEGIFYRTNRADVPNSIDANASVDTQLDYCEQHILKRLGKRPEELVVNPELIGKWRTKLRHLFLSAEERQKRIEAGAIRANIHNLDFDACGDFTMMSKTDWIRIEGYVELEMYSLHIDSMGLFSALACGMKQEIFPTEACTYHMEHAGGWNMDDPIEKLHFYSKKPSLEWWAVWDAGRTIVEQKRNFGINSASWGLNDKELVEIRK
jgi:hypothetical protein